MNLSIQSICCYLNNVFIIKLGVCCDLGRGLFDLKNLTWEEELINWMGYFTFYPHTGIDVKI